MRMYHGTRVRFPPPPLKGHLRGTASGLSRWPYIESFTSQAESARQGWPIWWPIGHPSVADKPCQGRIIAPGGDPHRRVPEEVEDNSMATRKRDLRPDNQGRYRPRIGWLLGVGD